MEDYAGSDRRVAFAQAMAGLLRDSRKRQHLTQAQVSERTGGVVSKAALANYETGLRSLRIDVFWLLTKALGEDAGALLTAAERGSGLTASNDAEPVTVDVAAVQRSSDHRLDPVRRWFTLRLQRNGNRLPIQTVTLDTGALTALAQLMGVGPAQCRAILSEVAPANGTGSAGTEDRDGHRGGSGDGPASPQAKAV